MGHWGEFIRKMYLLLFFEAAGTSVETQNLSASILFGLKAIMYTSELT
jgi:tryptophan synthase beta subunit